jgi:hypothetical protein
MARGQNFPPDAIDQRQTPASGTDMLLLLELEGNLTHHSLLPGFVQRLHQYVAEGSMFGIG